MSELQKTNKKRHNKVTFKPYVQNQAWLFPPTLGELIPAGHLVRLVNDAIDGLKLEPILNTYKGGGSSSYHPRMMLKALVYGYIEKIYSSRGIEKALQENICFMWLCGMEKPDHNTLNRFRNSQLKQTVKDVFAQVLLLLIEQGYVRLNDYYVDGTKMESVAGRYTFVWTKNVERYKSGLLNKIALLIEQIESANEAAEQAAQQSEASTKEDSTDTAKIQDSEALVQTIAQLNEQLAEQLGTNKKLQKQLTQLEEEHLPKLKSYEEQERLLDGRSSYSKTDTDATFMRTKDDHLSKGQLKPCYNIQCGTEDQFIINYTGHQTPSDMVVFKDHMEDTMEVLEQIKAPNPKRVGADAGYGSEENYEYLEEQGIEAFIKYPGYYQEQKGKHAKKYPFHQKHLYYNTEGDFFICPMGQKMLKIRTEQSKTSTGYEQTQSVYQARRCEGCPLRGKCHKSKTNRIIKVNHRSNHFRQKAKERLFTLKGIRMRKQRNIDVEAIFGHIKQCRGFRRFLLTGLDGVLTEMGLLAIAHNFKKWWVKMEKQGIRVPLKPKNPPKTPNLAAKTAQIQPICQLKRA